MVYALLTSKATVQYATVLEAIVEAAEGYDIENCQPEIIMSDFELGIINACQEVFPYVTIATCFFHLGQNLYRNIQAHGLQVAYNSADDRSVKEFTHKLAALALVPICDVECYFAYLKRIAPDFEEMKLFVKYFDTTYVRLAKGRRKAVSPRYPPRLWNHYDATIEGNARTNNASEGWHNRFKLLVGLSLIHISEPTRPY